MTEEKPLRTQAERSTNADGAPAATQSSLIYTHKIGSGTGNLVNYGIGLAKASSLPTFTSRTKAALGTLMAS